MRDYKPGNTRLRDKGNTRFQLSCPFVQRDRSQAACLPGKDVDGCQNISLNVSHVI